MICSNWKSNMRIKNSKALLPLLASALIILLESFCIERTLGTTVSYDSRALVIDGKRRVLQSGSIHYPRSLPEVWPELIGKAKEGGLDVIESYVFWNYHEPVRGQYHFKGRFDLVRFVKTVKEAGLFVHLRIGPYACAEWNYGGFPMWLHFIPEIQFRTTNLPFMNEMERFLAKIVSLMREEYLFASQGGPIILAQVENEYGNVEWAYGIGGQLYVKWAAETAINMNTTVPWVMCVQSDAPDPIINTCNGFYCNQFTPNSPSKPKMWTENYCGWFTSFGYPLPYRPVEDLAFAVARFFESGGTFQNYYMYFGGTNFGRTAGGPLVASSYDYDAPLDEYGFIRQPKWGHLRDLHKAIKLCEEYLTSSEPTHIQLGVNLEAHVYYKASNDCAAFLANFDSNEDGTVEFNGHSYFLPAWSVSILPDCRNVAYNTMKAISQRNIGDNSFSSAATSDRFSVGQFGWSWYKDHVGVWGNNSFTYPGLLEQINTTKDESDFLWYSTSINVDKNAAEEAFLHIFSLGHAALVFVNKQSIGFGFGNHDDASFNLSQKFKLQPGNNAIDILSMIVGLQNYGPWFDIAGAGVYSVIVDGFGKGKLDLALGEWTYQVGVEGEHLGLDNIGFANSSFWTKGASPPTNQSLIWYKATFSAPKGSGPLVLDLSSMGKGQAWVNGQSIGRYWPAYLSPMTGCSDNCDYRGKYSASKCQKNCGNPSQTLYHIPRSWVHHRDNLLVLHEEIGGDPLNVSIVTKSGQEICAFISETDPPPPELWKPNLQLVPQSPHIRLSCEKGWRITSVSFASFGTPQGSCGTFSHGSCHVDMLDTVKKSCIGKEGCSIMVTAENLGDPCPGVLKIMAVEALCSE